MHSSFYNSLVASGQELSLFLHDIIHNRSFMGFLSGMVVAVIVVGVVLTKDPRHIPLILRYSPTDSFQKIAQRDSNGTYLMAYSNFVKIYTRVRTLFMIAVIMFMAMFITAMMTYQPGT